jgi:hypothetical protein
LATQKPKSSHGQQGDYQEQGEDLLNETDPPFFLESIAENAKENSVQHESTRFIKDARILIKDRPAIPAHCSIPFVGIEADGATGFQGGSQGCVGPKLWIWLAGLNRRGPKSAPA